MAESKKFKASDAELESAQRNFDFLLPIKKALYNVPETAKAIGREQDFVRELLENGRLEGHADSAFGKRKSNLVTRRSVLVYLARTANYDPAQFLDAFEDLFRGLTNAQLARLITVATQIRANRPLNAA